MTPSKRKLNTVSIIPERKHGRPAGNRIITRSTTVRPFVYGLPASKASPSKTRKIDSSVNSYLSTPAKTASSRRKRNAKCLKTVNADIKDSFENSLTDFVAKVPVSTENLNTGNTVSPLKTPPNISALPQSKFDDHKEVVIAARKKNNHPTNTETSFVAKQKQGIGLQYSTYSSEEAIKKRRKSRHLVDSSHEALQKITTTGKLLVGTEIQPFDWSAAKKNLGDPTIQSSVPLSTVPNVIVQEYPITSLPVIGEHNSDVSDKYKSNSMPEITAAIKSQQSPLISETSTPAKLKPNEDSNKSFLKIPAIVSSGISTTEAEGNHSLLELSPISKECDISNRVVEAIDVNCKSPQHMKLKKCSVILEHLEFTANWKCPIKETQEAADSIEEEEEEEEEGNDETPNRRKQKTEEHLVQHENSERNKTQEDVGIDGECVVSENEDAAQGEMIVTPITSPKSSALDADRSIFRSSESSKDTEQELLSVSSVIAKSPDLHSSEKCRPQAEVQPDHVQNDTSQIRISESLAELQSAKHQKPSKSPLAATKRSASDTNKCSQYALLDADIKEPVIIAQKEPLIFQEKELWHSSNGHLTYTAVTTNIRTALSREPKKSRRKARPYSHRTKTSDRHPLFKEHKKIKLWKGKTGNRKISDICDLDIALDVIEEVIKELSEESENNQELLHQIQKKCEKALHKMMLNIHEVKRRNNEAKQLMETVKELAVELDDIVDKKIRLQGMLLKSKAKKITGIDGPTWEDFSKF